MSIGFVIYLKDIKEEMEATFPVRPSVCFAVVKHGSCVLLRNTNHKFISRVDLKVGSN